MKMKKLISKLFSLPIRYKLFLTYLLIIVFFALSNSILIINISTAITKNNSEELTLNSIEQLSRFLDSKALEYEKSSLAVLGNVQIQEHLKDLDKLNSEETSLIPYDILEIVSQNTAQDKFLVSYTYVMPSGKTLSFNRAKEINEYTYDETIDKNTIEFIRYNMNLQSKKILWFPNTDDINKINMVRELYDIDNFKYLGLLIVELSSEYFDIVPVDSSNVNDPITIIANKNNEIILSNRQNHLQTKAYYLIAQMFELFGTQKTFEYYDKNFMATGILTSQKNWKIVTILSMDYLLRYADYYKFSIILITVISFFIAGFIAYYLSRSFTKNIHLLVKSMCKVEEGNFDINIIPHSEDEIGLLSRRFSIMVKKINDLINRLYKQQIEKKNLEFKALQSQINPHFLYNTLGSIMWLAHRNNDLSVVKMLKSLIDLLRFSTNTSDFCLVEEETDYIKKYLILQKYRLEDRFEVQYCIDAAVLQYKIPRFIIQPFVENALFHGIELSKSNGIIKIIAYSERDNLYIEVHDNGIGMNPDKIASILSNETEEYLGLNSIGVANTNRRIKLYLGDDFGVTYISAPGQGTIVKITIPIQKGNFRDEDSDS